MTVALIASALVAAVVLAVIRPWQRPPATPVGTLTVTFTVDMTEATEAIKRAGISAEQAARRLRGSASTADEFEDQLAKVNEVFRR